eukprot:TRINITY_DN4233_c0_g1_i1.p1 TRINITY_DN4233_c0_g1~~TRINITY_DN4233_c0_g1_i1.p1  ORF type:complete len:214 (+),score=3.67 TRINITY_DN4233_c0_g1_i1:71-712(+)
MAILPRYAFAILLSLYFLLTHTSALQFYVDHIECINYMVPNPGDIISGSFVVFDYDGGWQEVEGNMALKVTAPTGEEIYTVTSASEDKFVLYPMEKGLYKFCFQNLSPWTETVEVNINVGHYVDPEEYASDDHLRQMASYMKRISEKMDGLQADQEYFRARDTRRRKATESTGRRVLFFAFLEAAVLVAANVLQVLYLRRLFERRTASHNRKR